MPSRDELHKMYWSAAYLFRRDPGRIRERIISTLSHVITHSSGILQERAAAVLKEVSNGPGPDADPPAAG